MPALTQESVAEACERILGRRPETVDPITDRRQKSVAVTTGGRRIVVTRRETAARAALEAHVLNSLHARKAPVPALLGIEGRWLVQEWLGETPLSRVVGRMRPRESAPLLDAALDSLSAIHDLARTAGLARQVRGIGLAEDWLSRFIAMPGHVGAQLSVPAPTLDTVALARRLAPAERVFIKWDARPPNAMPRPDGSVAWFDWEHCGCRDPLDDLAWFLGDESLIDDPEVEAGLIARHLPAFRGNRTGPAAATYLRAFGALHMSFRLSIRARRYLRRQEEAEANHAGEAAAEPAPEVVLDLCRRGARWAAMAPETAPLAHWYGAVGRRFGA